MKVLLIKDVYKLGRAGDIKKVATGYGRNYLIPQGLAVLATPGALKQVDHIREQAETKRAIENKELSGLAKQLSKLQLVFPVKAGETGKLYGSVTTQMLSEAIQEKLGVEIERHQIDTQPIRTLGVHKVNIRLTIDLIPEMTVLVHREGESPESALAFVPEEETEEMSIQTIVMDEVELEEDQTVAEDDLETVDEELGEIIVEEIDEDPSDELETISESDEVVD
jgi:large subunit ribosomal protein L9